MIYNIIILIINDYNDISQCPHHAELMSIATMSSI